MSKKKLTALLVCLAIFPLLFVFQNFSFNDQQILDQLNADITQAIVDADGILFEEKIRLQNGTLDLNGEIYSPRYRSHMEYIGQLMNEREQLVKKMIEAQNSAPSIPSTESFNNFY